MKKARQIILIIGYTIFLSFFIFSMVYGVNVILEPMEQNGEEMVKIIPILALLSFGAICYGIAIVSGLVTLVLNFKIRNIEGRFNPTLDALLIILPILAELVILIFLFFI